jgi:hypothetical protein
VIGLDRIVGVPLDVMPSRGDQFIEHAGVDRGGVGDHLAGGHNVDSARRKNLRAVSASRRVETPTSMTCPCWSTVRYTYRHTGVDLHVRLVDEPSVAWRVAGEPGRVGRQRK